MEPGQIETVVERIDAWRSHDDQYWKAEQMAARVDAAAKSDILPELVKARASLTKHPAAIELIQVLEKTAMANIRILEFGCANGLSGDILAANDLTRTWKYTGADVNAAVIQACRKRYPEREFIVVQDDRALAVDDGGVDVVLVSGGLELVKNTAWLLSEFGRICRSSAVLSHVPCRQKKPPAIYWRTTKRACATEGFAFHLFNEEHLYELIRSVGFHVRHREISATGGEWTPPDDTEPVKYFTYVLEKDANAREQELEKCRVSNSWLESRLADMEFEIKLLHSRLEQSQSIRNELERELKEAAQRTLVADGPLPVSPRKRQAD